MVFVDLEKAFATVPREMVMATLHWMRVPEAEVVVGEGASEEFDVNIGLLKARQRAEPAAVHSSTGPHQQEDGGEGCHEETADNRALVANGKQELQETLEEWNGLFTRHGLKLNLEKPEVLHIGHQREDLDIELEGKKLTQRDSFVYLVGAVCGDGKMEREVRRRVQAWAHAWRAVEGVMADRWISKRLTGKQE